MLALQRSAGNRAVAQLLGSRARQETGATVAGGPRLARMLVNDLVAEKPWIYKCTVKPYEDQEQFGHKITIDLALNGPDQLFWLERTDRPYVNGMEENAWTNMYQLAGEHSDVFAGWAENSDRQRMTFEDPPSIRKTPNNSRRLEFFLHFVGDGNGIVITARQDLATDGEGRIQRQDFTFVRQQISDDDTLSNPIWDEA